MEQLEYVSTQDVRCTGEALKGDVLRAVAGLAGLGVREGDRVALLMRNDLPLLVATLALQHLGAYPVQLNWHAQPDETGYVLRDCAARILIGHSDLLRHAAQAIPVGTTVLAVTPSPAVASAYRVPADRLAPPEGALEWRAWLQTQQPSSLTAAPPVESIIYTSGTTGKPKGVRRFAASSEQAQLTERMRQTVFGVGAGDRVLVPAPLYHTAPNLFGLRAVRKAACLVLPARFDAEGILADIERHRITHVYAVPTMFVRLLDLPAEVRRRYDLSSVRCVLHAGGPCSPSVKKAMLDWLGPVVHEYYGSTETGPNTFIRGDEWLSKPGSVGRAAEGVHVSVHDEMGQELGPNQVGELFVLNRGYADFTYLNLPDARTDLQRGDLIATGDLGYRDDDGYYFLCDRKRDLVISGGVNIYPAEIEATLSAMDGVADCAVFGIPDTEFGEALAAYVEPLPGRALTETAIRSFLGQRLANFKLPRVIEMRERLPREESGKIKKRLLREPYWDQAGRRI